jgi:hypothetical protein
MKFAKQLLLRWRRLGQRRIKSWSSPVTRHLKKSSAILPERVRHLHPKIKARQFVGIDRKLQDLVRLQRLN